MYIYIYIHIYTYQLTLMVDSGATVCVPKLKYNRTKYTLFGSVKEGSLAVLFCFRNDSRYNLITSEGQALNYVDGVRKV